MKNRRKIRTKLLAWFGILVMVLTVMTPTTVYAGDVWENLGDDARACAKTAFSVMISKYHLSREVALGLCANIDRESTFTPAANENGGTGWGLFQWSGDRRKAAIDAVGTDTGKGTDSNFIAKQVAYAMKEAKIQAWKDYTSTTWTYGVEKESSLKWKQISNNGEKGWNEILKMTDGVAVATAWMLGWERPQESKRVEFGKENLKYYKSLKKNLKGGGSGSGSDISYTDFAFVGDSRTVGMFSDCGLKAGTDVGEVIAHVGAGQKMLNALADGKLATDCSECGGNGGTTNHIDGGSYEITKNYVVIWLGVNDIAVKGVKSSSTISNAINTAAKKYQDAVTKLVSSGKKVIWVATGNVHNTKCKSVSNTDIGSFNNKMKKWCNATEGVTYVKINRTDSLLVKVKTNKNKTDAQGLHYSKDVYEQAWGYIKDAIDTMISEESTGDEGGTSETSSNSASIKVTTIMDESDFLSGRYLDIKESVVSLPDTTMLTVNEQKQIAQWGNNIEYMSNTWVDYLRSAVSFLGIMITIYCMLLYVIYWFDRVNTIIDFPILPIVTLGVLEVSPDDKLNTYSANSGSSRKIVTHQNMVAIVFSGVLLGVLLISGIIYKIVALLLQLIDYLKGIIFG